MKKHIATVSKHLFLFIGIEILFVFAILHEFPEIYFFGTLGLIHASYWVVLIISGYIREYLTRYWQKFLVSYIPVIYHVIGHIYIGYLTIDTIESHHKGDGNDIFWILIGTASLGILIFLGERLLHRTNHCNHHHYALHKHCKERGEDNAE